MPIDGVKISRRSVSVTRWFDDEPYEVVVTGRVREVGSCGGLAVIYAPDDLNECVVSIEGFTPQQLRRLADHCVAVADEVEAAH